MPKTPPDRVALFWAKVDKRSHPNGYWLWTGCKIRGKRNYGQFCVGNGKKKLAHRYSYELKHGPVPPCLDVCHHCDNPPCVRPSHLFTGTRLQNMDDARRKGRLAKPKALTCWRGHLLSYRPNGAHVCRTCLRVGQRDYRARTGRTGRRRISA